MGYSRASDRDGGRLYRQPDITAVHIRAFSAGGGDGGGGLQPGCFTVVALFRRSVAGRCIVGRYFSIGDGFCNAGHDLVAFKLTLCDGFGVPLFGDQPGDAGQFDWWRGIQTAALDPGSWQARATDQRA